MKKLLLVIAVAVFATTIFLSCKDRNPVERIVSQYKDGKISEDSLVTFVTDSANYSKIAEWAKANSDKDNVAAFLFGISCEYGHGVDKNLSMAKAYLIKAANGKLPIAMRELGYLYATYPGHENTDSAMYWYLKAAEAGDGNGYSGAAGLKIRIATNNQTPLDTTEILKLLQKGVELKSTNCISTLAGYYYNGYIVPQDKKKTYNLLNSISEEKLDAYGLFLLGQLSESGDGGATQNFTTAYNLFRKSNDKRTYPDAACKVGVYLLLGQGVEQNDSLAIIEFRKAANVGSPWGMYCVAYCYETGHGVEQDICKANNWYVSAAKNGFLEAIEYCEKHNLDYK